MLSTQAALILAIAGVISLAIAGYVALRQRQTYEDRESDAYTACALFLIALILLIVASVTALV